jgi:GAF domain-containing protein
MNNLPSLTVFSFNYKSWRESFIVGVLRVSSVLGAALLAISFPTATFRDRAIFIVLYLALLVVTFAPVEYKIRAFFLLATPYVLGVNSILAWGPWLDGSVFFIAFIALSALLFDERGDLMALGISVFTLTVIAFLEQFDLIQPPNMLAAATPLDWTAYTVDFAIVGAVFVFAVRLLKQGFSQIIQEAQNALQALTNERAQLENRVRERTEEIEARAAQLRSSASISNAIAEQRGVVEVLETATQLVSEQFGYYHVGLYLLDERKRVAFLQASSSAEGKQRIGQGLRIEPGRFNPFYRVIESKLPHFASDDDPANFFRDSGFPSTRSRMLLPLTVRGSVIGILDLHAEQLHAFNNRDAETFQTVANLVAITIENARLMEETQNLARQAEAQTFAQTRENWTKFSARQKPAYQYTPAGVRPLFNPNPKDDGEGLRVPLILHGQNIGVITVKRKGANADWSERERILVEKIAAQAALALENSRLVEETQKRAQRDQVVANISARVRETLDIEAVLRTAATELRKVFDLKEAEISVGSLDTEKPQKQRGVP